MSVSRLLQQHLSRLKQKGKAVLDLACGSGGIFADKNARALAGIAL